MTEYIWDTPNYEEKRYSVLPGSENYEIVWRVGFFDLNGGFVQVANFDTPEQAEWFKNEHNKASHAKGGVL